MPKCRRPISALRRAPADEETVRFAFAWLCGLAVAAAPAGAAPNLRLDEHGYFARQGLNVIVFSDVYPEGHQTGVTVIQHGRRVAANGDLRLEISPGQWSPVPRAGERTVDAAAGRVSQRLSYPDPARNGRGFNPTFYPDLDLSYRVSVTALDGDSFRIIVDLDRPLPPNGPAGSASTSSCSRPTCSARPG